MCTLVALALLNGRYTVLRAKISNCSRNTTSFRNVLIGPQNICDRSEHARLYTTQQLTIAQRHPRRFSKHQVMKYVSSAGVSRPWSSFQTLTPPH